MTSSSESPFTQRLSYTLISYILVVWLLYIGRNILTPMALAAVFALFLTGPCNWLERKGVPRGLASLLSFVLFIAIGTILFFIISAQIANFSAEGPRLVGQVREGLDHLLQSTKDRFHISNQRMDELMNSLSSNTIPDVTGFLGGTFSTIYSTVILLVLIPVYTFLLLYYRHIIAKFIAGCFESKQTERVYETLVNARAVIQNYTLGLLLKMIIVATLNCIGFFILGFPDALLMGVIAAVLNIIPYLGIFTACILSILISITTSPAMVVGVVFVLLCVHLIDAYFILPLVVSSKVKINAFATIVGVITGGAIWGIPGMFLAIPFMAILKLVSDEIESRPPWGVLLGADPSTKKAVKKKKTKQSEV